MPEYRYKILGDTLKELNSKGTKKQIDRFWFESNRNYLIKNEFKAEPGKFWDIFESYNTVELRKQFTNVYEDVAFLDELKEKEIKLAVVTGSPSHITDFEISLIGKEKFDAIVMAHVQHGIRPKPHPHGILECLKLLKAKSYEAFFVGNSDEDTDSAKHAGVFDIFIDRGEYPFPHIKPSLRINTLYDLRKVLL